MRDAIIVGAGPAGSATAIFLARQGQDVLLLDRAVFPRDKPCGEFLTPGCVPILKDLGVWGSLLENGLHPLSSAILRSPGGHSARYVPAGGEPAGWSMRRTLLDHLLVQHARNTGVEFREGVAVRSLIREGGVVSGVVTSDGDLRARLVIGADGSHSMVAREMGVVRPIRRLQRLAIVSHWRGIGGDAIEMRSRPDTVCGFGPLSPNSANVSIVVRIQEAVSLSGRAEQFLDERIQERMGDLADNLTGATMESPVRTTGCFGHTTRSSVADGVMLVGDASCFIDPFTGEGIYFALRGAELASSVAAAALREGNTSASRLIEYEQRRSELRNRYRLCDAVQAIVRTPPLMNRFIAALCKNPWAADRLMSILGDVRPAADALNPRLFAELLSPA